MISFYSLLCEGNSTTLQKKKIVISSWASFVDHWLLFSNHVESAPRDILNTLACIPLFDTVQPLHRLTFHSIRQKVQVHGRQPHLKATRAEGDCTSKVFWVCLFVHPSSMSLRFVPFSTVKSVRESVIQVLQNGPRASCKYIAM